MSQDPGPLTDSTTELGAGPFRLRFSALSDLGRVRKDNQDSGYAGPWVLTVCDGVGGAARGDVASSTAVQQIRQLDEPPSDDPFDLLGRVAGALNRAHVRIGELVEDDPGLTGTSTTAVVALFDGRRLGIGHVGDSRAYLYRGGTLRLLTHDHTFVQTLIDEGRITEEEARTHPHRNLILKALDGVHDVEPDLFQVDLAIGDRVLLCSDGASGVLTPEKIADILGTGTPDFAVVELIRASLEAGSSDNITCVVADVVAADMPPAAPDGAGPRQARPPEEDELSDEPLLVGAAANLPRRAPRASSLGGGLFWGHRTGDTGELEPVRADLPANVAWAISSDPIDPEQIRYAPRPPRRYVWLRAMLATVLVLGLLWIALVAAWTWSQRQYFVSDYAGYVAVYRGLNADLPGISLSEPYATTNIPLDRLSDFDATDVRRGIDADGLEDAWRTVDSLAAEQLTGGESS